MTDALRPNSIRSLVESWPSRADFASDVGAPISLVHKWIENGRIPSPWQHAVVNAAAVRGLELYSAEWMLSVHSGTRNAA